MNCLIGVFRKIRLQSQIASEVAQGFQRNVNNENDDDPRIRAWRYAGNGKGSVGVWEQDYDLVVSVRSKDAEARAMIDTSKALIWISAQDSDLQNQAIPVASDITRSTVKSVRIRQSFARVAHVWDGAYDDCVHVGLVFLPKLHLTASATILQTNVKFIGDNFRLLQVAKAEVAIPRQRQEHALKTFFMSCTSLVTIKYT